MQSRQTARWILGERNDRIRRSWTKCRRIRLGIMPSKHGRKGIRRSPARFVQCSCAGYQEHGLGGANRAVLSEVSRIVTSRCPRAGYQVRVCLAHSTAADINLRSLRCQAPSCPRRGEEILPIRFRFTNRYRFTAKELTRATGRRRLSTCAARFGHSARAVSESGRARLGVS
jgi:hypothetical protein